ncbi:hypothetical protein EGT71_19690 [Atlantibacter subterranea]|uniref:Uncharacterized protein n=1 Tax=Atlantibacter subterraneus TaxID=255519 RepID=A0A427UR45_9ENTR|nr:hypothetical protein [Atlantibacter subterranea]RSB60346.1 hypothetical protein EGK67_18130 [Atlantibacter subterranea]RSE02488.1 hypothetical protein EGT84_19125 [Atlantibacter subterranea]RSE22999.1 hypothetical protein EGT71_19690 [Atlantibacter subterranea]
MRYFVHAKRNEQGRHELHVEGCDKAVHALEPVALGEFDDAESAAMKAENFLYLPLTACECCGVELEINGTPSPVMETALTSNF